MKRLLKILAGLVAVLAVLVAGFLYWAYRPVPTFEPYAYQPQPPHHWPTDNWQRSTPEAQGMNSVMLLEMVEHYQQAAAENPELFIDSMTVIRNGHIVAEIYPNPNYLRDHLHVIHSATKSIVSILIGIAIDRGLIDSVDQKLIDVFAQREIRNLDNRKRAISIRDLLTMETGIHSRDSFLYAHEGLLALQQSDDWVQFALDLPMAATPGERFDYSNISTFLLGAVLAEVTGTNVLAFANETLFGPLGIDEVRWEWRGEDLPIAWARMWLKPNDLAKIGLLYLQQGRWDGKQIVPADWVRDSLTPSAFPKNAIDLLNRDMTPNRELSTRNWVAQRFIRPFTDGYGYQWWLDRDGNYTALGTNGQYLIVSPEYNLIYAVTSKSSGMAQFKPAELFYQYVLPAVEAEKTSENREAGKALAGYADPPAHEDVAGPIPELPEIAEKVSGITYAMDSNPYKTDNVRLLFDKSKPYAELSYTARESWAPDFRIGLDGIQRYTNTNVGIFAAAGKWMSRDTFAVEVEIIGYTTFDSWEFRFVGDQLIVTEASITGTYTYTGNPMN